MNDQELEEHRLRMQVLMKEAVAPLLERIDTAEASLAAEREKLAQEHAERLTEARARFKASLMTQLVAGALASNTLDYYSNLPGEIAEAGKITDDILELAGVKP
jgi:hypothetical protein